MAEPKTLEEAVELQNKAFDEFKLADKKRDDEIKALGKANGETLERLAKTEADLEKSDDALNKIQAELGAFAAMKEELETKLQKFERSGSPKDEPVTFEDQYADAYQKWMRGGGEKMRGRWKMTAEDLEILERGAEEKSLSTDSGEDGGYAMPAPQRMAMIEKLIEFSPIEELANIEVISIGDSAEVLADGVQDFACEWVSERESRGETAAAQLRRVLITAHEIYANPFITRKALDDPATDLAAWINRRLSKRFAVKTGTAYAIGSGDGQPGGIATNTAAQTDSVVSGHASQLTGDGLIDLYYDLPEIYARAATWVLRRATLRDIRKLKASGTGEYLFTPATTATPPAILERPYREALDMPAVSAGTYPIAFGDIEAAYTVARRQDVFQIRDALTNKPFVGFYTTLRRGGEVVLVEAYRLQKIST